MNIRLAALEDVAQLVQMRWDFSEEEHLMNTAGFDEFNRDCSEFLINAMGSGNWYIWVAETERTLVSHMYLQLIHKVPRPGKSRHPHYGYVTNVYTRPAYRSQGIGSRLHNAMEIWSKENEVEFLVLWPSRDSVRFYARNGFSHCKEAMEKHWD
ncbi:GNAT family N-acetyltransferase [Paenibacillus sacheonensis]|nr:GNAT superfamily N-acetyltransferase [Paenibacillus sacheonensis]